MSSILPGLTWRRVERGRRSCATLCRPTVARQVLNAFEDWVHRQAAGPLEVPELLRAVPLFVRDPRALCETGLLVSPLHL